MSQNTFSSTELLTYANLQIAAEALYGQLGKPVGVPDTLMTKEEISEINKNLTATNPDDDDDYLTFGNKHTSKFSPTQATEFVKDWEIVSHLPNTATGFSGTLFKATHDIENTNIKDGDLVISFRSTEFVEDQLRDSIATNTLEISKTGWAMGQISDMERWFLSLKDNGLIGEEQPITVTGYSLGGHLATSFHILHSEQIKNTFTFNGAGVGDVGGDGLTTKEELQNLIKNFNNYKENGVEQLLTGKAGNFSVADFYNEIRSSLNEELYFYC